MGVKSDPPASKPRPLWLEVRTEGTTRRFCFISDNDRSISVGTLTEADVRIARPGVAPVHFHFERRSDQIWLVAGAEAELRLNAARVDAPRQIGARAIIEFSGVVVAASSSTEAPRFRPLSLSNFERLDLELADLEPSAAIGPPALHALPSGTPLPPIASLPGEPLGHQETVRMFRADLSDCLDAETHELAASFRKQSGIRPSQEGICAPPLDQVDTPNVTLTDLHDRTSASGVAPVQPGAFRYDLECEERTASYDPDSWLALERSLDAADEESNERMSMVPQAPDLDVDRPSTREPSREAVAATSSNAAPRLGFLSALGARAQRQPLAVAAGTLTSAAFLSLALVGLSSFVSRRFADEQPVTASVKAAQPDVAAPRHEWPQEAKPEGGAASPVAMASSTSAVVDVAPIGSAAELPPAQPQVRPAASSHAARRKVSPTGDEGAIRAIRSGLEQHR
jgi:hypothetical protein